jgi:uncharacterized protein YbjT (DUF2867 family)
MRIVVIGGSGLVGAKLVTTLQHRGHDVIAASRRTGVNTLDREGLAEVLSGAKVVIDVINSPYLEGAAVQSFFRASTQNVIAAAESARVRHHIVLSIVGTDRMLGSEYFRGKIAQETLVGISPIPHTILRSTQFFDFLPQIAETDTDGGTVRVAPVLVQPIAADEVAAALADLAVGSPRNAMIEHAGPEQFHLDDIVRRVLEARGDARRVVTDRGARFFGATLAEDTLTPDEGAIIGVGHFDQWLRSSAISHPRRHTARALLALNT